MSRRNKTQQNVLAAIEAALRNPGTPLDRSGVLAFIVGYLERTEPEISKMLDKVLTETPR